MLRARVRIFREEWVPNSARFNRLEWRKLHPKQVQWHVSVFREGGLLSCHNHPIVRCR